MGKRLNMNYMNCALLVVVLILVVVCCFKKPTEGFYQSTEMKKTVYNDNWTNYSNSSCIPLGTDTGKSTNIPPNQDVWRKYISTVQCKKACNNTDDCVGYIYKRTNPNTNDSVYGTNEKHSGAVYMLKSNITALSPPGFGGGCYTKPGAPPVTVKSNWSIPKLGAYCLDEMESEESNIGDWVDFNSQPASKKKCDNTKGCVGYTYRHRKNPIVQKLSQLNTTPKPKQQYRLKSNIGSSSAHLPRTDEEIAEQGNFDCYRKGAWPEMKKTVYKDKWTNYSNSSCVPWHTDHTTNIPREPDVWRKYISTVECKKVCKNTADCVGYIYKRTNPNPNGSVYGSTEKHSGAVYMLKSKFLTFSLPGFGGGCYEAPWRKKFEELEEDRRKQGIYAKFKDDHNSDCSPSRFEDGNVVWAAMLAGSLELQNIDDLIKTRVKTFEGDWRPDGVNAAKLKCNDWSECVGFDRMDTNKYMLRGAPFSEGGVLTFKDDKGEGKGCYIKKTDDEISNDENRCHGAGPDRECRRTLPACIGEVEHDSKGCI